VTRLIELGLLLAAVGQFSIAILNFRLVQIMRWDSALASLPLLVREVFHVHAWFISLTLIIFATLTWRFAADFASGSHPFCRWLACAIGLFWAIRVILQVTYYSSSHWRGITTRTLVHILLLIVYIGFAAVYLSAALQP
jgi:hypothetical protein